MAITKEFAKSIVQAMANYLRIPPCEITFLKMDDEYKDVAGFYVDDKYIININSSVVEKFSDLEFTSFLIHEMRHAYQHIQVRNNSELEPKELIKRWKEEFQKYKNPVGKTTEYLLQSVEIDAVAFTAYFSRNFFHKELIIPEIISKEVEKRIEEIEQKYI